MSTKEWAINGVDLNTMAYRVEEVLSGLGFPGRKGENVNVPYSDGARFVPKKPLEERTITLSMWVRSSSPDGSLIIVSPGPPVVYEDRKITLQRNLDSLARIFGQGNLMSISRKMADESIRTIQAECRQSFYFSHRRTGEVRFAVDLLAPYPLWEGAEITETLPLTLASHAWLITNPGTATTRKLEIKVTGATEGFKLENQTTGAWVRFGGSTLAGEVLVISSPGNEAEVDGANQVGMITHAGDPAFMVLAPGANSLVVTCDVVPASTLEIIYNTPYI